MVATRVGPPAPGRQSATDLLDRRFAAGEISAGQYRDTRRVLRGG